MTYANSIRRAQRWWGIGIVCFALLAAGLSACLAQRDAAFGLGMIPPKAGDFARFPTVKISLRDDGPIPDHFTLEQYLPPIGNQGQTGSCVGWSTAYYSYSMAVSKERKLTPEQRQDNRFLFSPGFIWDQYNHGNAQSGMQIFQAFEVLEKMGCAPLSEYPWSGSAQPWQPTDAAKQKADYYKARRTLVLFKGAHFGEPADPERMRHWLYDTKYPIVLGIPIYTDFPFSSTPEDFVYDKQTADSKMYGYHAICIIGYDKTKQAFLMVNSWGPTWGNQGKLWLSERFIADNAFQGCVQTPGGPRLRSYSIVSPGNRR